MCFFSGLALFPSSFLICIRRLFILSSVQLRLFRTWFSLSLNLLLFLIFCLFLGSFRFSLFILSLSFLSCLLLSFLSSFRPNRPYLPIQHSKSNSGFKTIIIQIRVIMIKKPSLTFLPYQSPYPIKEFMKHGEAIEQINDSHTVLLFLIYTQKAIGFYSRVLRLFKATLVNN